MKDDVVCKEVELEYKKDIRWLMISLQKHCKELPLKDSKGGRPWKPNGSKMMYDKAGVLVHIQPMVSGLIESRSIIYFFV